MRPSLLALLLVAAACRAAPAETPTATPPPPTATAVPAAPTSEPAAPTETAAPEATATAESTPAPASGPAPLTSVNLQPHARGLELPVHLAHAGDGSGRLFVVEKRGRIRVIEKGEVLETPFLDITDRVGSSAYEQGLLGLAFALDYPDSGSFYVNYTDRNGDTVVERYRVTEDPNQADPNSGQAILRLDQPFANHNGGNLVFGPDGFLWIGTGDGGSGGDPQGNGQNGETLLGKMLRLDVSQGDPYAIPPDNPFLQDEAVRDEIWALGLRNPWRYSFDRETGDLYIADVGQNRFEEVNFTPVGTAGGLNFGWNIMEGLRCFQPPQGCDQDGLVLPVAEYPLQGANCAVTGGFVYRGQAFPELTGHYFFGDFCSGLLWSLDRGEGGEWAMTELARTGMSISSFGQDEAGELYVLDMAGGTVSRLTP